DVIARYELDAFFMRDPSLSVSGIDVRPRGVNYRSDEVDKDAMAEWRRAFKALRGCARCWWRRSSRSTAANWRRPCWDRLRRPGWYDCRAPGTRRTRLRC